LEQLFQPISETMQKPRPVGADYEQRRNMNALYIGGVERRDAAADEFGLEGVGACLRQAGAAVANGI
jgi:hypothetical protein